MPFIRDLTLVRQKMGTRLYRIPYCYLTDFEVKAIYITAETNLDVVYNIHNDIPDERHRLTFARAYQYHPSFLVWLFDKSHQEMKKRNLPPIRMDLHPRFRSLKSKPLSDFVPPTPEAIADDVVYSLEMYQLIPEYWKKNFTPFPYSYIELAEKVHGYHPKEESHPRIGPVSGPSYHADAGWYEY